MLPWLPHATELTGVKHTYKTKSSLAWHTSERKLGNSACRRANERATLMSCKPGYVREPVKIL
eukprot:1162010-Pelagomonas_calceolata.AAC.3